MPDCINKLLEEYFLGDKCYGANLHVRLVFHLGNQGCLNKTLLVTLFRTSCPQTILPSSLYTIPGRSLRSKTLQNKNFSQNLGKVCFVGLTHIIAAIYYLPNNNKLTKETILPFCPKNPPLEKG